MKCRKWRWNPDSDAKSWKNDFFTKRPLKVIQLSNNFPITKVTHIVTSLRNSRTILNDFQSRKNDKKGPKNDKKGPKFYK
jgi:hypothetical protein